MDWDMSEHCMVLFRFFPTRILSGTSFFHSFCWYYFQCCYILTVFTKIETKLQNDKWFGFCFISTCFVWNVSFVIVNTMKLTLPSILKYYCITTTEFHIKSFVHSFSQKNIFYVHPSLSIFTFRKPNFS